jgi:hypothetical protein
MLYLLRESSDGDNTINRVALTQPLQVVEPLPTAALNLDADRSKRHGCFEGPQ